MIAQSPYRVAAPRPEPRRPRRAGLVRRLGWWLRGGRARLLCARLRRAGQPLDAVFMMTSQDRHLDLRMLILYPDDRQRLQAYLTMARRLSAPPGKLALADRLTSFSRALTLAMLRGVVAFAQYALPHFNRRP